jgi:hypothetical protein
MQVRTIQLINCCASLTRICHLDERKPAWLSRVTIGYDIYALDRSVSRKGGIEILLRGLVAEIADKYVGHEQIPLKLNYLCRTAPGPVILERKKCGQKATNNEAGLVSKDTPSVAEKRSLWRLS